MVTLDAREPPWLVDELAELGYEVEVQQLYTGDFVGHSVIGEIKRGDDFFSSIVDQRLFNQAERMRATRKKGFLILAGNLTEERFRLKPVLGALMKLVFSYDLAIIPVPNLEAAIAYAIHQILMNVDSRPPMLRSSPPSSVAVKKLDYPLPMAMLMCIPGIGPKHASLVTRVYPSLVHLFTASRADLETLEGIGSKRAQLIYDALRCKNNSNNNRAEIERIPR